MPDAQTPIINIAGDTVALGPLRRDLIPTYVRWINDFATMRTFGDVRPYSLDGSAGVAYERHLTATAAHWFTIYEANSLRPIGHTDLFDIDERDRTAEFGILIGEADVRGKGYGTETARLMLDYAFTALGMHSVFLRTDGFNLAGQRAYAKAGFKEIGRRRERRWMDGRWWDEVFMDCLASEFASPVLARILKPDEPH
jgi:RimJ/RimL family protein N-acetyltransferase